MNGHGKVVCECGKLIAQCRCMQHGKEVTVVSPCTHKQEEEGAAPTTMFDNNHAQYVQHKIDVPAKPARHLIDDGHNMYETSDGLAFTLGVCMLEAEMRRDTSVVYKVQHPNNVDLYHVTYMSSGQVLVTKVGA